MTYLDRINHLWNLRRTGALRSSDHELCAFLLDAFNRLGWKNPMTQTNALICGLLSISELSLMHSRNRLKQDGLIDFKPGKKGSPTMYFLKDWSNKPSNALSSESANNRAFDRENEGTSEGHHKSKEKDEIELTNARRWANAPTLAQVIAAGQRIGLPESECERFWNHFEAVGWLNKHDQPILNWQAKLGSWKADNNQTKPNGTTHQKPAGVSDRNAGTLNAGKASQYGGGVIRSDV